MVQLIQIMDEISCFPEVDSVFPIEMFQTRAIPEIIPQIVNCPISMEHINDHGNDLVFSSIVLI